MSARVTTAVVAVLLAGMGVAALAVPDRVRIPAAKPRPGAPPPAAQFSHFEHGQFRCYSCHPGVFPQALAPFTHADMSTGRFCARCHDGGQATAIDRMRCEGCHVPR